MTQTECNYTVNTPKQKARFGLARGLRFPGSSSQFCRGALLCGRWARRDQYSPCYSVRCAPH
eukprot:1924483-Pyramimonas_sp.AAC.1